MNWYHRLKLAQFTAENTVNVENSSIQVTPYDPIVDEVKNRILEKDPQFGRGINTVNIVGAGPGFGNVESTNPADINIRLEAIKSEVARQMGLPANTQDPNYAEALKRAIEVVFYHEKGHVTDALRAQEGSPDDQLSGQSLFPGGEPFAERNVPDFQ